jgi:mannose-1-phosphate guanylyltransferase
MHLERDTKGEIWGLVLAAGDGTRLAALTLDRDGRPVPKQFCALAGEGTLLEQTFQRIGRIVPSRRIVTVVAERHRRYWERAFSRLQPENVVVQPENRGTAAGILLPLLAILERDPDARVVMTPSDHYVADERTLQGSIAEALSALERPLDRILLLGVSPDSPDGEYGWIVPRGGRTAEPYPVERFVEKPDPPAAEELARNGGVWNSFILVARARTLLELFRERAPALLAGMAAIRELPEAEQAAAVAELYREQPVTDFSRDLLQGSERRLGLVIVPPCGWSDLGTPERVRRCAARRPAPLPPPAWPRSPRRRPGLDPALAVALG